MNVEQRLIDALRDADRVDPSPDLWSRVVHSIEEDQAHRRRVVQSAVTVVGVIAALMIIGVMGLTDGPLGRYVRFPVAELIETLALVALVLVLGPAIRRFGRGYATDLFPATPATAASLIRLLDLAYVFVFAGFIMMTAHFDFAGPGDLASGCFRAGANCATVQSQFQDGLTRVGGLLIVMGLLHALTIMSLPVVALVFNSTRVGRALPRWLVVIMVIAGAGVGFQLAMTMLGLIAGGE